MLQNAKDLGVDLDGTRTERRENATQVAKQTLKTTPASDPDVVGHELDTDALQRTGKLEGTVKGIKLPGAATTREWLGSSAPAAFHQGVATAIFQMVALVFATKDLSDSDRFNKDENERKLAACIVSIVGNIIETAAETVAKAETHPLSAYIAQAMGQCRALF
ncbi:hypothetical protein [Paraburkholderia flava]|uniref:hypothetical protein n=1 Tax=Paraburkholderia flava TaxID=2547393 RepID=UPI00106082FD|nr:hypothetical protein [Paraburkholderia flava]